MKMLTGLLCLFLAVTVAACASSNDDPTGRTWELTELEGSPPVEGTTIDMTLTSDSVSGSAGCNQYTGTAVVGDGEMTLGPDVASTMMACADPVSAQEQKFLAALGRVTAYEMGSDSLMLLDDEGIVVATFE